MSINIQDTFKVNIGLPIDSRIVASTSTIRDAITYKYDGLSVFQISDRKTYVWNASTSTWSSSDISGSGDPNYIPRFETTNGLTSSALFMTVGSAGKKGRIGINTNDPKDIFQVNTDTGTADPFLISQSGTNTLLAVNWYNDGTDKSFTNAQPSAAIKYQKSNGGIIFLNRAANSSALNSTDSWNSNILARFYDSGINIARDLNLNNAGNLSSAAYIRATASSSTKALPDYTWNNDKTTGIYHPLSGRMGFTITGSQKLVLTSNGLLISGSDTTLTAPNQRLHINGDTGTETFIAISNGTTTGIGSSDSFLIGINNEGWPQFQSRFNFKPILIRFANSTLQGGSNSFTIAPNFFTIFSGDFGEGFNNTKNGLGDRLIVGSRKIAVDWLNISGQSYRQLNIITVPSNSFVVVESLFATSIVYSGSTKQFKTHKLISSFTVGSGGVVSPLGTPDLIAENGSSSTTFIGGAQVVSGGLNTLAFQIQIGSGSTQFSGRSVVSFSVTINNYQGN